MPKKKKNDPLDSLLVRFQIILTIVFDGLLIYLSTFIIWSVNKLCEPFLLESIDKVALDTIRTISTITTVSSFTAFAFLDMFKLYKRIRAEMREDDYEDKS